MDTAENQDIESQYFTIPRRDQKTPISSCTRCMAWSMPKVLLKRLGRLSFVHVERCTIAY